VEFVNFTVTAIGPTADPRVPALMPRAGDPRKQSRPGYFRTQGWAESEVYDRELLNTGTVVEGPAVIEERMSTTIVHPGQTLSVDEYGNCLLRTTVNSR
jgi:N-methylhydantoinase A